MKQLIRCPTCEEKGIKQTLAEVLPDGAIIVQRRSKRIDYQKQYFPDQTIIRGEKMYITCGNCGEIAYKKEL